MTHADTDSVLLPAAHLFTLKTEVNLLYMMVDVEAQRPRDTFQDKVRDARVQLVVEILELITEQRRLYALGEEAFPLDYPC